MIKVSGEVIGSKNSRGLKNYLVNLTEFLENPRGLLYQCALPWADPWGLNEIKIRGVCLYYILFYMGCIVKKWNDPSPLEFLCVKAG